MKKLFFLTATRRQRCTSATRQLPAELRDGLALYAALLGGGFIVLAFYLLLLYAWPRSLF